MVSADPGNLSPPASGQTLRVQPDGWLAPAPGVDRALSPHFNERPVHVRPELLVIHGISLPEGCFGGQLVDDLFMGRLLGSVDPAHAGLTELRVSSHFVIWRNGGIRQYVGLADRAWHAGVSSFQGRENCNDFSVGIELEGCDTRPYEPVQLQALVALMTALQLNQPTLTHVAGHCHIAPGRKTDPGPYFPWRDLQVALRQDPTTWKFPENFS
jgi:AmpD protein